MPRYPPTRFRLRCFEAGNRRPCWRPRPASVPRHLVGSGTHKNSQLPSCGLRRRCKSRRRPPAPRSGRPGPSTGETLEHTNTPAFLAAVFVADVALDVGYLLPAQVAHAHPDTRSAFTVGGIPPVSINKQKLEDGGACRRRAC